MSQLPPPAPDATPNPPDDRENRGIAMLNYGLLFTSIFFAGIPALIAVALAYARKSKTGPGLKKHFRFQIRIFWIAFFIALLAGACGISGVVLAVIELATNLRRYARDGALILRPLEEPTRIDRRSTPSQGHTPAP